MKAKYILIFICLSCYLFFSCSKESLPESIGGKIVYKIDVGLDYYIKDLKTKEVNSYKAYPQISPSGSKIAFYTYPGDVRDRFFRTQVIYNKQINYPSSFLWSPDDNKLAMFVFGHLIKIIDLPTSESSNIVVPDNIKFQKFITWSESDDFIYFKSKNNTNYESYISRIKPDGSEFQNILTLNSNQKFGSAFDLFNPSNLILFTLFDSLEQEARICKINTNGSEFQTIYSEKTNDSEFFKSIKISPNGQNIAYYIFPFFESSVYLIDITGKNKRLFWENAQNPQWSKDGSAIMVGWRYYIDWNTAKWDIRIKGLDQSADNAGSIIENGPVTLSKWYFE
ncbi:MAG: hypothetical protein IPM42_00055 [Saprospiraceae bacterium]|nr:hypothetical protein [Saprospiraceae bacterium]